MEVLGVWVFVEKCFRRLMGRMSSFNRRIPRRNVAVEVFREIYDSHQIEDWFFPTLLFIALKTDFENFLADFTVVQDAFVDALAKVSWDEEYSIKHVLLAKLNGNIILFILLH